METPVVIDNGSGMIKAGFGGDEEPKLQFPTFVGRPRHQKVMSGGIDGELLVGDDAVKHRGVLKLNYPISHGIIEESKDNLNWNDMQKIWEHTLEVLGVQNYEQHPILLTEAPNNPRSFRAQAAKIFFETFSAPALYVQVSAILSLYASGRTTGVVLDSGDGVTSAVPVYHGFAVPQAIQRTNIAGRDVTEYLQFLLQKAGHDLHTSAEFEIVKHIKEQMGYVAFNIAKAEDDAWEDLEPDVPYALPDGKEIVIQSEKFKAPEVLFKPSILGQEYMGMHQCVYKAITKSDMDLRKEFYSNILLSGGSTMFKGLGERLLHELKQLSPRDTKIQIYAPRKRTTSTYLGGSILSTLAAFKKMLVTRKDWEEKKERALNEKCLL